MSREGLKPCAALACPLETVYSFRRSAFDSASSETRSFNIVVIEMSIC